MMRQVHGEESILNVDYLKKGILTECSLDPTLASMHSLGDEKDEADNEEKEANESNKGGKIGTPSGRHRTRINRQSRPMIQ